MIRLSNDQIDQKIQYIQDYKLAQNAADGSKLDANANVTIKNIATLEAEINKDINIQINIKQLGMSHLVYPGALHTRFHHALGAMHLRGQAIDVLRGKGHTISADEALGASIAILLHDIGHFPLSHAAEPGFQRALGVAHHGVTEWIVRGNGSIPCTVAASPARAG